MRDGKGGKGKGGWGKELGGQEGGRGNCGQVGKKLSKYEDFIHLFCF